MILGESLKKAYKLFPKKEAIVCQGQRWTYEQFSDRINRLSHGFTLYGIEKDDKVAILLPNCHCFLESYYAIAQIGATAVPINYRLSPREIAFILKDSESKLLIADPIFSSQVDSIREELKGTAKILWTKEGMEGSFDLNYEELLKRPDSEIPPEPSVTGEDM